MTGRFASPRGVRDLPRVAVAGLALLALLAGTVGPASAQLVPPPAPVLEPAPGDWPNLPGLEAAAYVLVDASSGQILAARDAEVRRAVASTVKVLTALSVVERVDLDEMVTVGDVVLDLEGSGVGLQPGDQWSVEQLVEALIARSGNDAAKALAVHVAGDVEGFTQLMVADAVAMGLDEPTIVSPSGLDDANQLSALDLATISRVALQHADLAPILAREMVTLPSEGTQFSRNLLLGSYPGATGVKTGFTLAAGNSLIGSARQGDRELIAVVLDAGDDPARFEAAMQLLDLGFDRLRRMELAARLELAVGGGAVLLEVAPLLVTVPTDREATLAMPLPIRPPDQDLTVPIEVDGEVLGATVAALDVRVPQIAVGGGEAIGRAAADGIYAALRAAAGAGRLR